MARYIIAKGLKGAVCVRRTQTAVSDSELLPTLTSLANMYTPNLFSYFFVFTYFFLDASQCLSV